MSDLEFLDEFFSKTPEFSRFNSYSSVRLGQFSGSFPLVLITRDKKIFIIRCIKSLYNRSIGQINDTLGLGNVISKPLHRKCTVYLKN